MVLRAGVVSRKRHVLVGVALFLCLLYGLGEYLVPSASQLPSAGVGSGSELDVDCLRPTTARPIGVEGVTDGDTVRLAGGDRLRLIGVNTPELARDGVPSEPLAEQARQALKDLLASSERWWLEDGEQPRDHYGRRLGHLFLDNGQSVEQHLLAEGLGFLVAVGPNLAHIDCLAAAQGQAERLRLGVWGDPAYAVRPVSSLDGRDNGFRRVRGQVTRVSFKDNGWWLQLDGKLGLKIALADQANFDRNRLRALAGRSLEARGWLRERDGGQWWSMQVSHPSMLILDD